MMHTYRVRSVHRVVDGDTVDAVISLGFGLEATIRFRVAGVDTYELFGPHAEEKGKEAMLFTRHWFSNRRRVVVRTFKGAQSTVGIGDGAFGRWLGDFYDDDSGEHLGAALHTAGYSKPLPSET
jgi:micrococcal nuclease